MKRRAELCLTMDYSLTRSQQDLDLFLLCTILRQFSRFTFMWSSSSKLPLYYI